LGKNQDLDGKSRNAPPKPRKTNSVKKIELPNHSELSHAEENLVRHVVKFLKDAMKMQTWTAL